jgi:hypothetical protein
MESAWIGATAYAQQSLTLHLVGLSRSFLMILVSFGTFCDFTAVYFSFISSHGSKKEKRYL